MNTEKMLLYAGGAFLAYELFLKPATPAVPGAPSNLLSSLLPGVTTAPAATPVASNPATMVGINSGVRGGNGSFYTCSNYSQLAAADPNLMNPNYQMTAAQAQQYLANYSDLSTGLTTWIGQKQPDNVVPANINQAAQEHWKYFGCAEKRIYYPLSPPSTAAYIPPPANAAAKSSGGSWVTSALSIAGTVVGLLGTQEQLTAADCQALFTMSAVIKDILPLYEQADPVLTRAIEVKLNSVLSQYA